MKLVVIPLLLQLFIYNIKSTKTINSGIYYSAPYFNIKNTNITFGSNTPVGEIRNASLRSFAESVATICQAVLINEKSASVSIDGTINLAFKQFYDIRASGQDAVIDLLGNDLYFSANNTKLNREMNLNLAGYFSILDFGTAKVNDLSLAGYNIPMVISGDLARVSPNNKFSGVSRPENTSFFRILDTFEFNAFDVVLNLLKFFNWTLVANLYQANSYGYRRQQSVLNYEAKYQIPKFACNTIFSVSEEEILAKNGDVGDFCRCVTSKSTINIIILWMSTDIAALAIASLRKQCGASKKWTFIITDDYQTPENYIYDTDLFRNSLLIRKNGPWDVKSFFNQCQEKASPEVKETVKGLLENYYNLAYNCTTDGNSGDFQTCTSDFFNRKERCVCTLTEFENDPYTSKVLFAADIISVYAEAISLLQNNCTYLNSKRWGIHLFSDFCSKTAFTPQDLTFAARFVNFTGYTGPIWFPSESLDRAIKTFYLYSAYNNTLDATYVGYLNISETVIDVDKISFYDEEIPISEIVPENPDLSYAVVDVFFGVAIIEIIICIALFVFFIYYRDYHEIKKSAPLVSLCMLTGILSLSLAQLFLSFGKTDFFCALNLFLFRVGISVFLASLLAKNYRIYKIFSNKKATAVNLTERRLLIYIGCLSLFFAILCTLIVAALDYKALLRKTSTNRYYQYVECAVPNKTWNFITQFFFEISIVWLILASLILSFMTRHVTAEYSESRILATTSIVIAAIMIIFIPLIYTLNDESETASLKYVVFVEVLTVLIIFSVGLLFMPKVYHILTAKKRNQTSINRIYFLSLSIRSSVLARNFIYYSPPRFNLRNSNVTFVAARVTTESGGDENSLDTLGKSLMIICQADKINRKSANVSFDGIMNIAFKNFNGPKNSGQSAIIDLLSNSLYYVNNNSRLNTEEGLNVTGYMGIGTYGTNGINSLSTNNFGIPSLSVGDAARSNSDNDFIGEFLPKEFSFFDIFNTQDFNSFNAILRICEHFNWTLVGNLYEENSFGYEKQRNVITYSGSYSTPTFTCNYQVPEFKANKTVIMNELDNYCKCINYLSTVQVSLLWMSTSLSTEVIPYLRNKCPGAHKWTFIVADDYQNFVDYVNDNSTVLDGTLLLRNNGPWDIKQYIENCEAESSPAAKAAIQELIGKYYNVAYNCFRSIESPDGPRSYEVCPETIENRRNVCFCTGDELSRDQYVSKYLFAADMVSAWAYAIDLLQRNCSFLNNQAQLAFPNSITDFCSLTTFSPAQLSFAMRFINFTGYTGEIYFTNEILTRAIKSYFLYSVNGTLSNEVLVGELSYQSYTINDSSIYWIDGNIPISEIVPQNTDLSYAIVDVFFGITIFEMIVCTILIILYVININNPIIRRSAPYVTLIILLGIFCLILSGLIFSFKKTDAICTIVLIVFHIGIIVLITGLLVKNFRVYKIFSNRNALPVWMPESKLLWTMTIFTVIYVGVIIIFVCVFGYEAEIKTSSYDKLYSYVECVIPSSTWNTIFRFVLIIPLLLLLIANLILAWLTRNVKSDFRETNSLATVSCIIFAAFSLFIPLGLTFGDEVNSSISRYVLHLEFLTITIVSSLSLMFLPKIYAIYAKKRKNNRNSNRSIIE